MIDVHAEKIQKLREKMANIDRMFLALKAVASMSPEEIERLEYETIKETGEHKLAVSGHDISGSNVIPFKRR